MRSQSAMEYLMTYGWAILIIGIVISALFFLGVFTPSNYASKAQPGSCIVTRPSGPGSPNLAELVGTCQSLPPKYVLMSLPNSGAANPMSASLNPSTLLYLPTGTGTPMSMSVWVFVPDNPTSAQIPYFSETGTSGAGVGLYGSPTDPPYLDFGSAFGCATASTSLQLNPGGWNFIAFSYNGGSSVTMYVNQTSLNVGLSCVITITPPITSFDIGQNSGVNQMPMSNIQIYSTALSANQMAALYREGIGGDPIDLEDISGWWPLNGDVNDYSGNQQNGNVVGNAFWDGDYSLQYPVPPN